LKIPGLQESGSLFLTWENMFFITIISEVMFIVISSSQKKMNPFVNVCVPGEYFLKSKFKRKYNNKED